MSDFEAADLPAVLFRTTLALWATYLLARGALRLTKSSSPFVHRAICILALAQGWWLVRLAIDVPWYDPPARRPLASSPIFDAAAPPPNFVETPESHAPVAEVAAGGSFSLWNWRPILVVVWLAGAVFVVARDAVRYVRFVRDVPLGEPAAPEDEAAWLDLLARRNVRRLIPLRMTENIGPVLCRLPRGYRLLAPQRAWRSLSSESRLAVLRHELAHYERGDVWKSLAARFLALPQWFNPLAWLAVRHFDEAAEWACDAAACRAEPEDAPAYGKALLALATSRTTQAILNTAAQGRGLALRIERILAPAFLEDSRMKKTFCLSMAAILLLTGGLELKLVARAAEDQAGKNAKGDQPPSPQHERAAKAMLEAAKKAYEATAAGYDAGTATMPSVHTWSQYWLDAERGLAQTKQEELNALLGHWQRMSQLHRKVEALYLHGAKGGELEKYFATEYYLAQAEMWLVDARGRVPEAAN